MAITLEDELRFIHSKISTQRAAGVKEPQIRAWLEKEYPKGQPLLSEEQSGVILAMSVCVCCLLDEHYGRCVREAKTCQINPTKKSK